MTRITRFLIRIVLVLILGCLSYLLSWCSRFSVDYYLAFECGLESILSSRQTFSLRFYCIILVFLIFDVEIVLLLPLVVLDTWVLILVWLRGSLPRVRYDTLMRICWLIVLPLRLGLLL